MGEPKYRRKVPTVHQILEMVLLQGGRLRCYRTRKPITLKNFRDTQREHVVELGLFATDAEKAAHDTPDNWRMSFSEAHAIVTNGTKATTAGSSKHRIAKAVRMEKERLTPAKLDEIKAVALAASPRPLIVQDEQGRDCYVMEKGGLMFMSVNRGPRPKRGGFRKDPARVRGVDGKVKSRKAKMGVRRG